MLLDGLLTTLFGDWAKSVHRYGSLYIAAFLFDLIRIQLSERAEGFEARFGTDTATIVFPWNLPSIAQEHTFGPEPLVLFLSNPFGRETIRRVLASLETSLVAMPRDAYLVYINPRFGALMQNAPFLRTGRKAGAWWRPWSRYVIYAALPNCVRNDCITASLVRGS